jgi:hypothetical protein
MLPPADWQAAVAAADPAIRARDFPVRPPLTAEDAARRINAAYDVTLK